MVSFVFCYIKNTGFPVGSVPPRPGTRIAAVVREVPRRQADVRRVDFVPRVGGTRVSGSRSSTLSAGRIGAHGIPPVPQRLQCTALHSGSDRDPNSVAQVFNLCSRHRLKICATDIPSVECGNLQKYALVNARTAQPDLGRFVKQDPIRPGRTPTRPDPVLVREKPSVRLKDRPQKRVF